MTTQINADDYVILDIFQCNYFTNLTLIDC